MRDDDYDPPAYYVYHYYGCGGGFDPLPIALALVFGIPTLAFLALAVVGALH
jgi:hypothetical protein